MYVAVQLDSMEMYIPSLGIPAHFAGVDVSSLLSGGQWLAQILPLLLVVQTSQWRARTLAGWTHC